MNNMTSTDHINSDQRRNIGLPSGGTWYWRQHAMIDHWVQTGNKAFTVAFDREKPDGLVTKVYGVYDSKLDCIQNLTQSHHRFAYELIPEGCECSAHADIEWIGDPNEGEDKIKMVVGAIRSKIASFSSIPAEIYVLRGSRVNTDDGFKHSYHVIVSNFVFSCNHDTNMYRFFLSIHDEHDDDWYYIKSGVRKLILDLGIYTKNRCFRLPYCCKLGSDVPLVRISGDPFQDDLTRHEFDCIENTDITPMLVSNPTVNDNTIRFVKGLGHVSLENVPNKRARLMEDLPFPRNILSQMLHDVGDDVSQLSTVSQDKKDGKFVVQCIIPKKQVRKCLTSKDKTHQSNNCILFVKQLDDKYKVEYYCTDPECAKGHSCPVLGYIQLNVATGEWVRQTFNGPSSQTPPVQKYDPMNPQMNTYELVKQRHEEKCFKIHAPLAYVVLTDGKDVPDHYSSAARLTEVYSNKYYFEQDKDGHWKEHRFMKRWLCDRNIKEYTQTVVEPPTVPNPTPGGYNLWKPFRAAGLKPIDEQHVNELIQPIVKHIMDVIANGDMDAVTWLLDYQANMIKRPHLKSQVAISLYGEEGCGKGIIFEFLRKAVLGSYLSFQTSNPELHLFSQFANGAFHKVCIQVDEVKSLHEHSDRLKDFITNDTLNYEEKGKSSITVSCHANLILTSNNPNALTISPNDRRFALFRCSSIHKPDRAYFNTLGEYLKRDDVARAYYQHLMSRDLSKYPYDFQSSRPITEYYRETQLASIPVVARFISSLINDHEGTLELSARDLYTRYKVFKESGCYQGIMTETSFCKEMIRINGVTKSKRCGIMTYSMELKFMEAELKRSNKFDPDATMKEIDMTSRWGHS